jgi:nitric oxide reductase subunit C
MHLNEKNKVITISVLLVCFLTYSIFLYSTLPITNHKSSFAAQQGKMIWQKYNCNACHQVYGQGGFIGPDLTNSYSQRNPRFIKTFIKYGTPTMPGFNLSNLEISQLLAFLQHIDSSGSADPRTYKIYLNGIAEQ